MGRQVSDNVEIAASPTTVFDLLADPAMHAEIDGSGSVQTRLSGPPRLYLGATFAMRMRLGLPYAIRNQVVEFEEDRRIAWRHFARHVWRYELSPTATGARVVETFDYSTSPWPRTLELLGFPERNRKGITSSLRRLRRLAEAAERADRSA